MTKHLLQSWVMLVDLIWPKFCQGCGRPGEYICKSCNKQLLFPVEAHYCHVCGVEARKFPVHSNCQEFTNLSGVLVGYEYFGLIEKLLHGVKYGGYYHLVDGLLADVAVKMQSIITDWQPDVITFVPTARHRQWARGFNQSEYFTKQLNNPWNLPMQKLLTRSHYKHSQVGSNATERKYNVMNDFAVCVDQVPERVVIVDDIMTTGSTLEACAGALTRAGSRKVFAVVASRRKHYDSSVL